MTLLKYIFSCQGLYYCYELMCSDWETACEESLLISSSLLERSLGDVSPLLEKAFKHNIHSVLYMLTFLWSDLVCWTGTSLKIMCNRTCTCHWTRTRMLSYSSTTANWWIPAAAVVNFAGVFAGWRYSVSVDVERPSAHRSATRYVRIKNGLRSLKYSSNTLIKL